MDSNKVEILGRVYSIKGITDREYLDKLASFVDSHMRQISEATGTVDTLKVAILAALNIADCYFKALDKEQHAQELTERNIAALTEQVQLTLSK